MQDTKTRTTTRPRKPRSYSPGQGAALLRLRRLVLIGVMIALAVLVIRGLAHTAQSLEPIKHPPIVSNSIATPGVQTGAVCRSDGGVLQVELLERVAPGYNLYNALCRNGVTIEIAR